MVAVNPLFQIIKLQHNALKVKIDILSNGNYLSHVYFGTF